VPVSGLPVDLAGALVGRDGLLEPPHLLQQRRDDSDDLALGGHQDRDHAAQPDRSFAVQVIRASLPTPSIANGGTNAPGSASHTHPPALNMWAA
jgi:hypothetical protein